MAKSSNTLLETACRGILELVEPAYIKDSDLRIYAANAAFADLLGFHPDDVVGISTQNLATDFDFSEWDEKERRTFVFGVEEAANITDLRSQQRYRVEMERFITDDDEIFIFGRFESADANAVHEQVEGLKQVASLGRREMAMSPVSKTVRPGAELHSHHIDWSARAVADLILEGVEELDVGMLVYDAAGYLRYVNAKFYAMDEIYQGVINVGMHVEDIIAAVHDLLVTYPDDVSAGERELARSEWIAGRLESHRKPYHEILSHMGDNRWVRVINRCLKSGIVICLRVDVSDQKALETRLQTQMGENSIYKAILEDLPVAAYVRDHDLNLVFGNTAYVDLIGFPLEQVLGQPSRHVSGDENVIIADYNEKALKNQSLEVLEFEYTRPDGRKTSTITRSRGVKSSDDNMFVVGSITDISDIRNREKQLIEAQGEAERAYDDLEYILDLLPAGVVVLDSDMRIELVNQQFCNFARIPSKESLIGVTFRDYLFDITRKVRPNFDDAMIETIVNDWHEKTRHGTDGVIEIALAPDEIYTYTAIPFDGGRVVATYNNVTEIRQREVEIGETRKALEETGALLKEASSVMEQGLLVIDAGKIIYVNQAYRSILGLDVDGANEGPTFAATYQQLIARGEFATSMDLVSQEFSRMGAALKLRESSTATIYFEKLRRWIKIELMPAGENRTVIVFSNITEIKLREQELERMVARAEAADRAKSEFLANMSHEIRTPMNGVLAMAGLLTATQLDARQKTFLDVVVKSGKTLLTIINDVLDFSKMDGGQLQLKHVVFSPAEAVEEVAMLLASRASERHLDFIIDIAPNVPGLVRSDAGRFRQILTNLLSNAIKFTDHGHVAVRLSAQDGPGISCDLNIVIEDTGAGMAADRVANIQQSIESGQSGPGLYPDGVGLGLPITVGLVRLFAGTLDYESAPDEGTVVRVSLPVAVESARARTFVTPAHILNSRILLMDDSRLSRHHLQSMMSGWGFEVETAETGAEGLEILIAAQAANIAVDIALIDYSMKDMVGIAIARAIRANPALKDTAIIFIADLDLIGDDGLLHALNVRALVPKPVRRDLMHETLVSVLQMLRNQARQKAESLRHSAETEIDFDGPQFSFADAGTEADEVDGGISILVAEDNEINKIVYQQILQSMNVSFCIVANGREAVDAWQELKPDVIFMDVDMPVMDGHEATRRIRQMEKGTVSPVTIVGVTPHLDEKAAAECIVAGMDGTIAKPLSPEKMRVFMPQDDMAKANRQTASR